MASARSASSPVIANTRSFACSLRSFRCAEIDRARRPAARRRSRTVVRDAAPAAWMRATSATISVIARTNSPGRSDSDVGLHHRGVSAHLVQLHHLLPGALTSSAQFSASITSGPQRAVILPSVDGCGTVVPSEIRQNRYQQIESATPGTTSHTPAVAVLENITRRWLDGIYGRPSSGEKCARKALRRRIVQQLVPAASSLQILVSRLQDRLPECRCGSWSPA